MKAMYDHVKWSLNPWPRMGIRDIFLLCVAIYTWSSHQGFNVKTVIPSRVRYESKTWTTSWHGGTRSTLQAICWGGIHRIPPIKFLNVQHWCLFVISWTRCWTNNRVVGDLWCCDTYVMPLKWHSCVDVNENRAHLFTYNKVFLAAKSNSEYCISYPGHTHMLVVQ